MSKSKPWKVTRFFPSGALSTEYRSQRAAYEAIAHVRELITAGTTDVTKIHVRHWEDNQWRSYEILEGAELA